MSLTCNVINQLLIPLTTHTHREIWCAETSMQFESGTELFVFTVYDEATRSDDKQLELKLA